MNHPRVYFVDKIFKVLGVKLGLDKICRNLYTRGAMKKTTKFYTPLNLKIDSELHRQLKIRAAEVRKTMTELVEAALRLYLNGGPKR